ncbi:hypothetical protein SAMN02745164_01145 [Marinitoga hydrogenitolerans DSM 16785]|uniref:Peptidase M1 membrane alanine aminopeptidase domain-containing protein n=1 Tax=Marinitoga hydrogenitolerans (strain DSM 16785 / JCM 12826 / AT1271) TaxID=1122195 RepID=A0A1M4WCG3_MARH1|nr:hypothetical protein [Marinitoga hydrogenitolerans]SHE78753.1 hypothetical protein SAMN02745164_01145 [Marinitoga hydrogenitolerans DSM 16785]
MDRRKYRRLFVFFLVIIILNFFKFVVVTNNYIYIFNPSLYPKFDLIADNSFFEGYDIYKNFNIKKNILIKLTNWGYVFTVNISKNKNVLALSNNFFIIYENNLKTYNVEESVIFSQFNIESEELKNSLLFLKAFGISFPEELYIFENSFNQSFFLPQNYIFLRKNDLKNGVLIHELSHYTFGYIIKRKNEKDLWPEIICEAIRLKYLYYYNKDLYNSILNKKKKENNTYSQIIKYPILLDDFENFITIFIKKFHNTLISDNDFFIFYRNFERRESN